ncbi:MAG: YjbQ family protein [Dermatophilaceae bacterium]
MESLEVEVASGSRLVTDLTAEVRRFCAGRADGLVSVFVPHATAGVAVLETGSGSEADLADALERVFPVADVYRHRHGSLGHGRDHVVPAFVSPSLTVPVVSGQLLLGVWQSIVLVDTNGDNPRRRVILSFLSG